MTESHQDFHGTARARCDTFRPKSHLNVDESCGYPEDLEAIDCVVEVISNVAA